MWDHFSISHIIELIGIVITVVTLHRQNVARMTQMETKIDLIYQWFKRRVIFRNGGDEHDG